MSAPVRNKALAGSCLCGQVKYTISGAPNGTVLCHCNDCRKVTGSAFATNAIFDDKAFTLLSGEDQIKEYVDDFPGAKSSPLHRFFCGNCGSRLWATNPGKPEFAGQRGIAVGSIDKGKGGEWKPQMELFSHRSWEWLNVDGEIVKIEGLP